MMKKFNIAASCVPNMHYMVDISNKLRQIKKIIDAGEYFTINRARQYGKTTTRYMLENKLEKEYVVINTSFEGIGDLIFKNEQTFSKEVFNIFADSVRFINKEFSEELREYGKDVNTLKELSNRITDFCIAQDKKVVLIIDEVDKSSNNQLFLSFIGLLRDKYIARNNGRDCTFWSVILLGVHDVKNLKLKLRPDEEKKYNSPWNVAVDFKVDMSFSSNEISTMLVEYEKEHQTGMDIEEISEEIYKYTSGYPYLVSKLCKLIEEELDRNWTKKGIQEAIKILLRETNTLFDDLIKNLENNHELYEAVYNQLILGMEYSFNVDNPITNIGVTYGIFRDNNGKRIIDNKIFEQRIYNYMSSKLENKENMTGHNFKDNFIDKKGDLMVDKILDKFQQVMKEEYSNRDDKFIEREGRLLFLVFLRPIINGDGFALKEVQISQEQRLDILITFNNKKYVIELKKWYGEEYHKKGLAQLEKYLEDQNLDKGYLLVFNFKKDKKQTSKWIKQKEKDIYEVII